MTKKKILVRVDGHIQIGLGHVYNMLTILNYFRDEQILIVMNHKKNLGSSRFRKHLYNVKYFKTNSELMKLIRDFKPDIIFNDILNTSSQYMKSLKKNNSFIVNFEDLGHGRKFSDLTFNPIFESEKNFPNEFYGHNYACVRDEFRIWKSVPMRKHVKSILISFGGTDPFNKTTEVLKILQKCKLNKITLNLVLGLGFSHKSKLMKVVQNMLRENFKIHIIEKSDSLAKHFRESDFAIISNGRTVFEVACMKVPMIIISVNEREMQHSFVKKSKGGFHIDNNEDLELKLIGYITKMLQFKTRKEFRRNLEPIDIANNAKNVIKIISDTYESNNNTKKLENAK